MAKMRRNKSKAQWAGRAPPRYRAPRESAAKGSSRAASNARPPRPLRLPIRRGSAWLASAFRTLAGFRPRPAALPVSVFLLLPSSSCCQRLHGQAGAAQCRPARGSARPRLCGPDCRIPDALHPAEAAREKAVMGQATGEFHSVHSALPRCVMNPFSSRPAAALRL